jgi:hypothetical protein
MTRDRLFRHDLDARRHQESVDSEFDETQAEAWRPAPGKVKRSMGLAGGSGRRRYTRPAPGKTSLASRLFGSGGPARGRRGDEPADRSPSGTTARDLAEQARLFLDSARLKTLGVLEAACERGDRAAAEGAWSDVCFYLDMVEQFLKEAEGRAETDPEVVAIASQMSATREACAQLSARGREMLAGLGSANPRSGMTPEVAPFPHREVIERSFERAIPARAHIGPHAAEASGAQGADAFAEGGEVAFASPAPDLHTAAHEAAHVLQETVGPAGGPADLEAHAEQAASLVAVGRSAAHLFGGPAAARELRRRPTGAASPAPEEPEPPEAPAVEYKLFEKAPLAPGMTVSAMVVFGNAAKPGSGPELKPERPAGEWNLDRLKQSEGRNQRLVERMRDSITTRFAGVKFEQQFELEGLPDVKVEFSNKLEAEGLKPGVVVEATFSGDVTEFAAKQGWIRPADPAGVWLQGELAIRVEAEDIAWLVLLSRARERALRSSYVIGLMEQELPELEARRRSVAMRREALSKTMDPKLWEELDAEHRALQEEIRSKKGIRGAARKRFDAAMKRIDDVSRKAKRTLVRAFARAVGERVAKHALKVIPVVGWISWASDAWEFGRVLWKLFVEDHAAGDSSEGKKGTASGAAVGEERETGAAGDGKAGGEVEGDGPGGESPGGKEDGHGKRSPADGAAADADGDKGPDPRKLHAAARAVYDVVITRGPDDHASIDAIWLEALDELVPRDLPAEKLEALCAALRTARTGGTADPDQILAAVARALDTVLRERSDEPRRPAEAEPQRGSERERQESVLTELPPSRLVEWKDDKLEPTKVIEQLPGLPFRLADGTVAEIVEVRIVEEHRPVESEVVPFRIVIALRRPDGATTQVTQQHAVVAEDDADGRPSFFKKGSDDIKPQLRELIEHDPSGEVRLKKGAKGRNVIVTGATLILQDAYQRQTKRGPQTITVPGQAATDAVVVLKAENVRGEQEVVDDLGQVHALKNGDAIYFVLELATTFRY